jgi:D-alanyl-lipoteichoic acid acyltransferase DltB (MBOAT superfamily)
MSYTIDVYRRQLEPARNLVDFLTFVSFFPQLVAGPIERATNLLPQFSQPSIFIRRDAVDGLRRILWGFFKKVVVADTVS